MNSRFLNFLNKVWKFDYRTLACLCRLSRSS